MEQQYAIGERGRLSESRCRPEPILDFLYPLSSALMACNRAIEKVTLVIRDAVSRIHRVANGVYYETKYVQCLLQYCTRNQVA